MTERVPSASSRRQRIRRAIALPLWVFVSFFAVQLVLSLIILGLEHVGVSFDSINPAVLNTTFAVLVYALAIAVAIGVPYVVRRSTTSLRELGLHRLPQWRELLMAPAGFLIYSLASGALVTLLSLIPGFINGAVQDTGFNNLNTQGEVLLAFFTLVVLAPIAEETLFRGYLFSKLKKVVPVWGAILITSVLFGLVHIAFSATPDWSLAADTFTLSLMLCTLRQLSGSLWPSILLHMIKNGIAFYILFILPIISHTIGG